MEDHEWEVVESFREFITLDYDMLLCRKCGQVGWSDDPNDFPCERKEE